MESHQKVNIYTLNCTRSHWGRTKVTTDHTMLGQCSQTRNKLWPHLTIELLITNRSVVSVLCLHSSFNTFLVHRYSQRYTKRTVTDNTDQE